MFPLPNGNAVFDLVDDPPAGFEALASVARSRFDNHGGVANGQGPHTMDRLSRVEAEPPHGGVDDSLTFFDGQFSVRRVFEPLDPPAFIMVAHASPKRNDRARLRGYVQPSQRLKRLVGKGKIVGHVSRRPRAA